MMKRLGIGFITLTTVAVLSIGSSANATIIDLKAHIINGQRHAGLELRGELASVGHDCSLLSQDSTRE